MMYIIKMCNHLLGLNINIFKLKHFKERKRMGTKQSSVPNSHAVRFKNSWWVSMMPPILSANLYVNNQLILQRSSHYKSLYKKEKMGSQYPYYP